MYFVNPLVLSTQFRLWYDSRKGDLINICGQTDAFLLATCPLFINSFFFILLEIKLSVNGKYDRRSCDAILHNYNASLKNN